MESGLKDLEKVFIGLSSTTAMPVLFVGHGSPMNAIENNSYTQTWKAIGSALPKPAAILSVSAHWLTQGTKVTAMANPETIHDFRGFPQQLFAQQYPAPGAIEMATYTHNLVATPEVALDYDWGLDHGTWSVLLPMFPLANIPVYQLSIDYNQPPAYHYSLAQQLKALRKKGVLIIGSGNIVHNLSALRMDNNIYDWAIEFDAVIAEAIETHNHKKILAFQELGTIAKLAHPTYDHFLPLLYSIGLQDQKDAVHFFNDSIDLGSISMRSVVFSGS